MKESQEELQVRMGEDPGFDYSVLNQLKKPAYNQKKEKDGQKPVEIKEFSDYFRVNSV